MSNQTCTRCGGRIHPDQKLHGAGETHEMATDCLFGLLPRHRELLAEAAALRRHIDDLHLSAATLRAEGHALRCRIAELEATVRARGIRVEAEP